MNASDDVFIVRDHAKRLSDFTQVENLSPSIRRSHFLGNIGPDGDAKPTTSRMHAGLSRPNSGTATISGADRSDESQRNNRYVDSMTEAFCSYGNPRLHECFDFLGITYGTEYTKCRTQIVGPRPILKNPFVPDINRPQFAIIR